MMFMRMASSPVVHVAQFRNQGWMSDCGHVWATWKPDEVGLITAKRWTFDRRHREGVEVLLSSGTAGLELPPAARLCQVCLHRAETDARVLASVAATLAAS